MRNCAKRVGGCGVNCAGFWRQPRADLALEASHSAASDPATSCNRGPTSDPAPATKRRNALNAFPMQQLLVIWGLAA